jgi:hypothetical protein
MAAPSEPPSVAEMGGHYVTVTPQGGFILTSRDGRDTPIPVDEYQKSGNAMLNDINLLPLKILAQAFEI